MGRPSGKTPPETAARPLARIWHALCKGGVAKGARVVMIGANVQAGSFA